MTGFHMLDAKPVSADSAQRDYGAAPGQKLVVVRADTWEAYENIVDGIPVAFSELLIEAGAKPVPGIDDDFISCFVTEEEI